jgi:hypothetical protein
MTFPSSLSANSPPSSLGRAGTNDPQGNMARQGFISIIKLQAFGRT